MRTVALFGIGNMGLPMGLNLLKAGFELRVAPHRTGSEALERLAAAGAVVCKDRVEMVSTADCVVSIVSDDSSVRDVFLNEEVRGAIPRGAVILEMTSCSPEVVVEVADYYRERDVCVLDAPVTGGVTGAAEGTLTIMGAGEEEAFEKAMPALDAMAARVFRLGKLGNGKLVKSMTTLLGAVNLAAVGEFYRFAKAMGLDLNTLIDLVGYSAGGSLQFAKNFDKLAVEDFKPNFTLALMRKDMGIALEKAAATDGLRMPLARLAFSLYKSAGELDGKDCRAIALVDRVTAE